MAQRFHVGDEVLIASEARTGRVISTNTDPLTNGVKVTVFVDDGTTWSYSADEVLLTGQPSPQRRLDTVPGVGTDEGRDQR